MTRSPLAYPLNRSGDMDVGGAADLQTDVMRFMAILSLCLVAIFALVQSIPITPAEPAEPAPAEADPTPAPVIRELPQPPPAPASVATPAQIEKAVNLTRPAWQPRYAPKTQVRDKAVVVANAAAAESAPVAIQATPDNASRPIEQTGFTLRFASDAALMRAVAAHHVGLYALGKDTVKRMTVSASRISFWDASTPNTFHEMEASTVPGPVVDALARTGVVAANTAWGVTLPGKVKTQMNSLMQSHDAGSLIINASGEVHWEEQ